MSLANGRCENGRPLSLFPWEKIRVSRFRSGSKAYFWQSGPRRRGAILAATLLGVLLLLLFAGAVAHTLSVRQRTARWDAYRHQCFWLAESALGRAVARYRADPAYRGESWQVSLDPLDAPDTSRADGRGHAEIRVVVDDNVAVPPRIHVTARYPDHPVERVVILRDIPLPVSP